MLCLYLRQIIQNDFDEAIFHFGFADFILLCYFHSSIMPDKYYAISNIGTNISVIGRQRIYLGYLVISLYFYQIF